MSLELRTPTSRGPLEVAEPPVARGGEGAIYRVRYPRTPSLVMKRYHPEVLSSRAAEIEDKLRVMVASPPSGASLCWPLGSVYEDGVFVGLVMPQLALDASLPWSAVAHAQTRRLKAPRFGVAHALRAASNAALALADAHRIGIVLGDVNESNLIVFPDATVKVIDCDSAQVETGGTLLTCRVGKADFGAPETVGADFTTFRRTSSSDVFSLAVLVFMLLTGGRHPYDGVPVIGDLPPIQLRIRDRLTPYFNPAVTSVLPAPLVPTSTIPPALHQMFRRTFLSEPPARPTALEWHQALLDVQSAAVACPRVETHAYDPSMGSCPYCAVGYPADPFSNAPPPIQTSLPPVAFSPSARLLPASSPVSPYSPSGPLPAPRFTSSPPPTPVTPVYQASSWLILALRHPAILVGHVLAARPILARLLPSPAPRRRAAATTIVTLAAASFVLALTTLSALALYFVSLAPTPLRILVLLALIPAGLLAALCSAELLVMWIVLARRRISLDRSMSVRNVLRLGFVALVAGPLAALSLLGSLIGDVARRT